MVKDHFKVIFNQKINECSISAFINDKRLNVCVSSFENIFFLFFSAKISIEV